MLFLFLFNLNPHTFKTLRLILKIAIYTNIYIYISFIYSLPLWLATLFGNSPVYYLQVFYLPHSYSTGLTIHSGGGVAPSCHYCRAVV